MLGYDLDQKLFFNERKKRDQHFFNTKKILIVNLKFDRYVK